MNVKFCKKCNNHLFGKESIRKNLCLDCREPRIRERLKHKNFEKKLNKILELPDSFNKNQLLRALFKSKRQIIKSEI